MKVAVADVCGGKGCLSQTSSAFRRKLVAVASAIGVDPSDLAAVIAFESGGTFSASVPNMGCAQVHGQNPMRCGTGLIQFMPSTTVAMAKKLGVAITNADIARWSNVKQLEWVQYYFKGLNGGTYRGLGDLYRTVFWPAARGKSDDYVATRAGEASYEQNRGLDRAGKGYITAADIDYPVAAIRRAAAARPVIVVETQESWVLPLVFGAIAGASIGYISATRETRRAK